jgi:two-component system, LytTR family, sensor kinase
MKLIIQWYFKFFPVENISKSRRVLIHALFWLLFGFLLSFASIANKSWSDTLILSYSGIIQNLIFFYGFLYVSIPLLSSRKTILLGIFSIVLVSVFYSVVSYFLYKRALDFNFFTTKSYMYDYAVNYVESGMFSLFSYTNIVFEGNMAINSLAIPLIIKFSRLIERYSRRIEKVSREKVELELIFLKSQINPHFLLNSINNIYSQVISKDKNAANTIITLSNLLKYILYHSQAEHLDLAQEVNFIRDFMDLEKLRNGSQLKIKFSQQGDLKILSNMELIKKEKFQ